MIFYPEGYYGSHETIRLDPHFENSRFSLNHTTNYKYFSVGQKAPSSTDLQEKYMKLWKVGIKDRLFQYIHLRIL